MTAPVSPLADVTDERFTEAQARKVAEFEAAPDAPESYAATVERSDDPIADAIREWAAPEPGLGWIGSAEVVEHAQEIADFLWERGLTR